PTGVASGRAKLARPENQIQEFHASLLGLEHAKHCARNRTGILFLHSAHDHAHVLRLDNHTHSEGSDLRVDGIGNLIGEPFLDLKPATEDLNQPGNLTQPDHLLVREISYVALTEKRKEVMLAHAEKINVGYDHHLVVFHVEESIVQNPIDILSIASGQV